jgi:hypothetical protein
VVKLFTLHLNVLSNKTTPMKEKERINLGRKSIIKGTFFYSKEDNNISSYTEEEEYDLYKTLDEKLLMALEKYKYDQEKIDTEECEVVVNLEGELLSDMEEIS